MAERMKATADKDEAQLSSKIAVTNTYRNQPLLFHVVGGSVRLGPFERREISRDHLTSPELAHLVLTGAIQVSELDPPDASESPEDDDASTRQSRPVAGRGGRQKPTPTLRRNDDNESN
jgi:hypothetical protein